MKNRCLVSWTIRVINNSPAFKLLTLMMGFVNIGCIYPEGMPNTNAQSYSEQQLSVTSVYSLWSIALPVRLMWNFVCFVSTVGPLGACSLIDGKGYNLGYIQSSPQAAEDGSISIVYQNGDRCGPMSRYSTRIILLCDHNPVSVAAPSLSAAYRPFTKLLAVGFLTQAIKRRPFGSFFIETGCI